MRKTTSSAIFAIAVARNALRILHHRRVLGVVEKFLFALELHEETRSIIVRGKDGASLANQETATIGNLAEERDDVGSQFDRRLVAEVMAATGRGVRLATVVPPQCYRIVLDLSVMVKKMRMFDGNARITLGKGEADFGTERIRLLVDLSERHRFDFCRVIEIQGAKRHIDRVARHITQCAGAKVLPTAPVKRLVDPIWIIWIMAAYVRPHRCRSNPNVPIQSRRNRIFSEWTIHCLRPDGAVSPHVNFMHLSDETVLNRFHRAAQTVRGAALI